MIYSSQNARGVTLAGLLLISVIAVCIFITVTDRAWPAETGPTGARSGATSASDINQKGFTAPEQKALVNFLLQNDMGKAVQANVQTLLNAHDGDCAVRLVMDSYGVPKETAQLFVRLLSDSDGLATAPEKW